VPKDKEANHDISIFKNIFYCCWFFQ